MNAPRRPRRRRLVLLLVAAVALGAYGLYRRHLRQLPLEWSGTLEAHTIDVGSRVGGRIQSVLVREGDTVQDGQPLIVFETGDLEAQRLEAEGQLEQARAALERLALAKGVSSARREEIAAAEARLRVAQVERDKATLDLKRLQALVPQGAAAQADLDTAANAVDNGAAQIAAAQAQLDQLLQGTPSDVKAAQGQVDAATGRLQRIRTSIDELTIHAPRAARVETLDLRPGDIVAPNATAAQLLEPDQLFVRIYVPETQLGHVRPGLQLPVFVDTFPGRAFRGVVESVNGVGEFTPRNLQTVDERANQVFASRVRLEEGLDVLRAGMAATVRVAK